MYYCTVLHQIRRHGWLSSTDLVESRRTPGLRTRGISSLLDLVSTWLVQLPTNHCLTLVFRAEYYTKLEHRETNYSQVEHNVTSPIFWPKSCRGRNDCNSETPGACIKSVFVLDGSCSAGNQKLTCNDEYRPSTTLYDVPLYCIVNCDRRGECDRNRNRHLFWGPFRLR